MPYTILTGDPRAVGTGNPPVDMNNVNDVLAGNGLYYNVLNTAFAGGADPTGVSSSSAAIQAAINAALSVSVSQFDNGPMRGPTVVIPFGNYLITTPLNFTGYTEAGIRITGSSRGSRLFSTGSTIFDFQTAYLQGFEFDHLTIDATGGHCFANPSLKFCWFHDLNLVQNSPGYSVWNQTEANSSLQNTTFADVRFWVYPDSSGNRSVPGWNILELTGGDFFAEVCWDRLTGMNMPNSSGNFDNSQYLIYLACSANAPLGYASTVTFRDVSMHNCLGGGIEVLSGSHVTFENVGIYDVYTQGTPSKNITSSLIKVGTYPSGMASRGIEFRGTTRSQGGLTTGSGPSDIEVSSDTEEVLIHGWSWTGWQATNVQGQINLNGALHCVLIAIDAGTTVLNPASDTVIISAGVISIGGTAVGGSAATGLADATGTVSVSAAAAPAASQVLTATSATTANWQTPSAGGVSLGLFNVLNTSYAGGADPTGTTDSAPAIQAAINAMPASGGIAFLPAGTYKINSTITLTQYQRMIGAGVGATIITSSADTVLIQMGNEQSDHYMRNWMYLADMTVNQTGGSPTHANVRIDGGGRGTSIQRVSTGGGKYGFELMDLDRCDFTDLSANNPATAGIFLEVGWQNTYGTITFTNCDTVLSNNNTYGFYVAANADQSGPNQPDRINFIGCMMYMSNGLTGCIGFYDKIGMTSTNFIGCLFEQNTRQYRNDGSYNGVNFLGCTFLDSTYAATDIAYLNGSGYYTFRDCRFQQATNCFNAVSNNPHLCLEGRNNFQGSISNLLTGTFGSKTGTDTEFIGDNILALGLNNQRFGYGFINNLVGNPVNIFPSTDGPGAINFLQANGSHVLASFNTSTGVFSVGAGTSSAGSAPVLTSLGAVSGTAIQLTDTTRDYQVYLNVTTAGTATSVTMGHTSGAGDVTIAQSETATLGQVYAFRLPAGWYFKWTGTTTAMGNQTAVGC